MTKAEIDYILKLANFEICCECDELDPDICCECPEITYEDLQNHFTNNWIPVTERLPEHPGVYLVTDVGGAVYSCNYDLNFIGWSVEDLGPVKILAWQPLPEPYQEVKTDECFD